VQLIDLCKSGDDALENIGQIVPRVDVVQLCRVDERCEGGPGFGAALLLSISMRPSSMKRVRPSQWLRV
jgi:hypothetical protein